jgi:hypothetical protein
MPRVIINYEQLATYNPQPLRQQRVAILFLLLL